MTKKTALVTGGSRGLGRAISVRLAKDHGCHILVNYSSNAAAADETVRLVEEVGSTAETIGFNVDDLVREFVPAFKDDAPRSDQMKAIADFLMNNDPQVEFV